MSQTGCLLVAVVASFLMLRPAERVVAQLPARVDDRVRIEQTPPPTPLEGLLPNPVTARVQQLLNDRLVLRHRGMPLSVSHADILSVELSRNLGSMARNYALIGFGIGALIGYDLGSSCWPPTGECDEDVGEGIKIGVAGGLSSALLGYLVGSLRTKWGAWETVTVESLIPSQGFGVGVRIRVR